MHWFEFFRTSFTSISESFTSFWAKFYNSKNNRVSHNIFVKVNWHLFFLDFSLVKISVYDWFKIKLWVFWFATYRTVYKKWLFNNYFREVFHSIKYKQVMKNSFKMLRVFVNVIFLQKIMRNYDICARIVGYLLWMNFTSGSINVETHWLRCCFTSIYWWFL